MEIFVLFSYEVEDAGTPNPVVEAVRTYDNVHLNSFDIKIYSEKTPLEEFFKSDKMKESTHLTEHLADVLR